MHYFLVLIMIKFPTLLQKIHILISNILSFRTSSNRNTRGVKGRDVPGNLKFKTAQQDNFAIAVYFTMSDIGNYQLAQYYLSTSSVLTQY